MTARYQCPKCKSTDLRINVSLVLTLNQTYSEVVPELTDFDQIQYADWNDDSEMLCNECDHFAKALHYDVAED